jgi:tetratricopeptide (TPR) repeat protein
VSRIAKSSRRVLIQLIALIGLAFLGLWFAWVSVSQSILAERRLQAMWVVTAVVEKYVIDHSGKWPESWEGLEQTSLEYNPSSFSWPQDANVVRRFVVVDFQADPFLLARQGSDNFDAIRPIGDRYGYRSGLFSLYHTLCIQTGNYEQSIRELTELIEQSPKHAELYRRRGIAYEAMGDLTSAANDFSAAEKLTEWE